jgi:hypothetical protein
MPPRPGQLQHPLNAKQTEDLEEQLEQLYRELNVLIDIFGLATKKGELLVRTDTGWAKVPQPGEDGLVLTSDKALAIGVKWAAPQGGGEGNGNLRYWLDGQPYGAL